jgi:tetratricopeptide (TPR) repeat protein
MKLTETILQQIDRPAPSEEPARLKCQLAKELEDAGDYNAACEALGHFWTFKEQPDLLAGLDQLSRAEVLLRQGTLTGWIGSTTQIAGSQEKAKDLIGQAITIFQDLKDNRRVVEAETELAYCYWRQGAFDEARSVLADARSRVSDDDKSLKAVIYLRSALLENSATRFHDSTRILSEASHLFNEAASEALKGKFHNTLGLAFKNLAATEQRNDYVDRALIEFTAASFHFENAGHIRYHARVENNLGFLFSKIGRFDEAQRHLERARQLFSELGDRGSVAQVDDTRAQVFIGAGQFTHAERVARSAVKALERGGEQSLLAEALTTHALALSKIGKDSRCRHNLQRAIEVSENSGDLEAAGRARLCLIEELGAKISAKELTAIYLDAAELLENSQDPATVKRLRKAARNVIHILDNELSSGVTAGQTDGWEGFCFKRETLRYERLLIERALRDTGGLVSRAAQLLGFKHHQSLISLINSRHKELIKARTTVRHRRRSLLSSSNTTGN